MRPLLFSLFALLPLLPAAPLTDAEIARVTEGFGERRDAVLERLFRDPYPRLGENPDDQTFGWNRLAFALAAFSLNRDLSAANTAVREVVARGTGGKIANGEERFHWFAPHLERIHQLFAPGGQLEPEVAAGIREVLWDYLAAEAWHPRFAARDGWCYWGSENHDAQKVCTLWGAAKLLAADPAYAERALPAGATPRQRFAELDGFVKEQFRERVRKGLLAECASPGYSKYTLTCWYNYHDFGDPELHALAANALTLWWADWAQEQLGAVRGGAKCRSYQGKSCQTASGDDSLAMAWFYLGIGQPRGAHPGFLCLISSSYRLPPVVMDLALDPEGRGEYEAVSRRPGLARAAGKDAAGINWLDGTNGGVVHYTYCTPDFIAGSWLLAKRPRADWAPVSAQNRWQGVILAGADPDARVYPQCEGLANGKTYNQYWSAQRRGTMIVARLPDGVSHQCGDLRLFVAPKLSRSETGGWLFIEAQRAWLAARFATDSANVSWDDPTWWRCRDRQAPLVLEVVRKSAFPTAEAFLQAILARRCERADGKLTYDSLADGTFVFPVVGDGLPTIVGEPLDLAPAATFRSPFVNEAWSSGKVVIRKGDREWSCDVGSADR